MIRLCWRLQSLPELGHIPPEARRTLIRQCVGRGFHVKLSIRAVLFAIIGAGAIAGLLSSYLSQTGAIIAIALAFAVVWTLTYQYGMLRVRVGLRYHLKRAFAGQRVPVCFDCGYDLVHVSSDRCPECGAVIRVPEHF